MTATAPPPLVGAGVRLLAVVVAMLVVAGGGGGGGCCHGALLKAHFYRHSCPAAEAVVRDIVLARVAADPAKLPPKLLRLFFHDCFVRVRTYVRYIYMRKPHRELSCLLRADACVRACTTVV
jgi:peroxidase